MLAAPDSSIAMRWFGLLLNPFHRPAKVSDVFLAEQQIDKKTTRVKKHNLVHFEKSCAQKRTVDGSVNS